MSKEFIIGRNPVLEALKSKREINKLWIAEGSQKGSMQHIIDLAKEANVLVQFVPRKKIDQMAEGNHQGVVASVAAYDYAELDDLFHLAEKRNETPFFLILDEIEDPHNLGSIMRTADAVGAHGIIIPKRRAVGLTATVAKASTGAIEHIPVVRVTNLARTVDEPMQKEPSITGTWTEPCRQA
jgi:23S rRNA (guanosine2251-2'-O)-methyltransferase